MTYIKKIVMHGFKSFARKTEIPFENSMNIIVGPNGSGKSNITDALCFVLGRLSIKSIRAAKASNLLFSGNKLYKGAQEAFVELVFENADKSFALDTPEVVIKRLVRKNGLSVYKINGETKTRQELLELLSGAGIDPNGFNIVLQGEIQDLVKSGPEDRRKVIEDVAGISIYETRKEKSLRELEKTEERLKEVSTVLKERTAYLKNLEKERADAIAFQNLELVIKRAKASLIHKEIGEKEKELWGNEKVMDSHKKEIDKLKIKIEEKERLLEELSEKISSVNKRIQLSTSNEQEVLHRELSDLKADLAGLRVRKENFEARLEQGKEKSALVQKKIKEISEKLSEIRSSSPEIKKVQEQRHLLKDKFDDLEKKRRRYYVLRSELATLQDKKTDKERYTIESKKEISLLERSIEALSHEIKYARSKEQFDKLKSETEEKISRLNEEVIRLESEILEKEKRNAVLEQDIKREERLTIDINKLEICPVCKQKVAEEHKHGIQDTSSAKIISAKEEIVKNTEVRNTSRDRVSLLRSNVIGLRLKLSEINVDMVKLRGSEERKAQIKRIQDSLIETENSMKELNEKIHKARAELDSLKNVENEYDDMRIRLDELNFSDMDVDGEIALKMREINRFEAELKSQQRDMEESEIELKKILVFIEDKEKVTERKELEEQRLYEKFQKFFSERNELSDQQKVVETDVIGFRHMIMNVEDKVNYCKIQKAQFTAQLDSLKTELSEFGSVELYSESVENLRERLAKAQLKISGLGSVNMKALEVFDKVEEQCKLIEEKVITIEGEKAQILKIIEEIDKKKKKSFMTTLDALNDIFTRNFSHLSQKGEVFLELENPKEPFSGGLNIMVKVSRGKYFDIASLSGGEKTMVSLALIFAIQEYKPYSFYIFDEIDAALDKHNSELLAALIKKHMKSGQYIIITHNDIMITEATTLYGVSMQENISKIVSLKV